MQQALDYAETLKIPYVFASNGDGFVFHDRTGARARGIKNLHAKAYIFGDRRAIVTSANLTEGG